MTENETTPQQDLVEQEQDLQNDSGQLFIFLAILAVFVLWAFKDPKAAKQIILVLLGFGGIVMIHELGHFVVAKLGGINVQAFSIGFPPVVLGIRKLKKGWRFRFLPKPGEEVKLAEGDNETEYQIGLIPFGGFVKMLGQSDTGAADAGDDPRSYANRPIWIRICVVSAGVIFNAIGAAVIFIILFMNGIDLPPGEVGSVVYNSPAYDAGIRAGDKIIAVNGDEFVDFTTVQLAPVLSSPGEPIEFKIKHPDDSVEMVEVIAESPARDPDGMRVVGINQAQKLTIDERLADDPDSVDELEQLGLRPGDEIKAVEDQSVSLYLHEVEKIVSDIIKPSVTIRVSRQWPIEPDSDQRTMQTVTLPLQISPYMENFRKEFDLANFASLVPQLQVEAVSKPSRVERMKNWFRKTILRKEPEPALQDKLKPGDVLLQAGEIRYPTYEELRKVTEDYKDKELPVTVLRKDEQDNIETIQVTVTPKTGYGSDRIMIGFVPALDMNSSVVAEVLPASRLPADSPAIPAGARITAIAGQAVQNFYDIASVLRESTGQTVTVAYQFEDQPAETSLTVPELEPVHAEAVLGVLLSNVLKEYTIPYKADNPAEAIQMGVKKVWQFIAQNYITLAQLIKNELPSSSLMGPVGIVSVSYKAAGYSLDRYLYFLGLISTALAVMNLLPLPVLDGGHIVLLLIEKITGRPIHEKVLAPIMYIGLALLLGLILWVSYNDVMRLLYS